MVGDYRGQALIQNLKEEIANFTKAGWRSCIDHIIKPTDPCPVCERALDAKHIADLTRSLECSDKQSDLDTARITQLKKQLRNIRNAQLPDPYDDRDISLTWLRKQIVANTNNIS
jgi:hypothetical protein